MCRRCPWPPRANAPLGFWLDPPAYRQLGILVRDRKDLRPAARRFITEAREIIDQIK
ncbi:unknown [Oscillibacter sp. CAG:241]|nr:unknown [Oscillibacter sp. CAG:241]